MSTTGFPAFKPSYETADERAIRTMRLVDDWTASGLLTREQRDRMAADLQVDLRRTNRFLRVTLAVFGFLIVNAVMGLVAVFVDVQDEIAIAVLSAIVAAAVFKGADVLVSRYRLYRFGIEEALAIAGVGFFGVAGGFFVEPFVGGNDDVAMAAGLAAAAAAAWFLFARFGYVYAALGAIVCAACVPFILLDRDWLRRVLSIAILTMVFALAGRRRTEHGSEFPGDQFALIEAAAWAGIYLITNLKISAWLSHTDESGAFYWATYAAAWMLPAAGIWIAVRWRHRELLDASAAMALATLMTNKAYLGAERYAWDPIVFGLLLIGVAVAVRRWLAAGEDGSRHGFVAVRLLASEKERLAVAGTASVLQPTVHTAHPPPAGPAIGGGGASGGGGATGKY